MTNNLSSNGWRMPAEWEPHEATWMSWPYNADTWEGHLEGAELSFANIIRHLALHEHVHVLVANEAVKARALSALGTAGANMANVTLHDIESGDVWIRDYGPIFVKNGKDVAWTKWGYNAYGGKYEDLLIGNDVAPKLPIDQTKRMDSDMILEGGSIDVNGSGTLLTTESCLLSPDRNPTMSREDIEKKLGAMLGVTNILWLSEGIEGDDTTGHVDDITRFVDRTTVVTVTEKDPSDKNHKPLEENLKRLKSMKAEDGTPLTVIELPMPKEFTVEDRRMAASYANFYIANGTVLVPTYDQPSDAEALRILQSCFQNREVVGIDCRDLIWGCGSIHCSTQQQPA